MREREGGGERERNCIVMDGYMLMNKKIKIKKSMRKMSMQTPFSSSRQTDYTLNMNKIDYLSLDLIRSKRTRD